MMRTILFFINQVSPTSSTRFAPMTNRTKFILKMIQATTSLVELIPKCPLKLGFTAPPLGILALRSRSIALFPQLTAYDLATKFSAPLAANITARKTKILSMLHTKTLNLPQGGHYKES